MNTTCAARDHKKLSCLAMTEKRRVSTPSRLQPFSSQLFAQPHLIQGGGGLSLRKEGGGVWVGRPAAWRWNPICERTQRRRGVVEISIFESSRTACVHLYGPKGQKGLQQDTAGFDFSFIREFELLKRSSSCSVELLEC